MLPRNARPRRTWLAALTTTTVLSALFAGAPIAAATADTDRLNPGEQLNSGERLISPNGQYVMIMQSDGNWWSTHQATGPSGLPAPTPGARSR